MSEPIRFKPDVTEQQALRVKIPHSPQGQELLAKLKALLGDVELPFFKVCPPTASQGATTQRVPALEGAAAEEYPASESTADPNPRKGTAYALDLRLEQEGWPPFDG